VRDAALAHVLCAESSDIPSSRLILSAETLWFSQILAILREKYKLKTRTYHPLTIKLASLFSKELRYLNSFIEVDWELEGSNAAEQLGFTYTDAKRSILEGAETI